MHWVIKRLLPMFGVQALHRPKKSPKIHIVAKVHLPKHRTVDNGYLDYIYWNIYYLVMVMHIREEKIN